MVSAPAKTAVECDEFWKGTQRIVTMKVSKHGMRDSALCNSLTSDLASTSLQELNMLP